MHPVMLTPSLPARGDAYDAASARQVVRLCRRRWSAIMLVICSSGPNAGFELAPRGGRALSLSPGTAGALPGATAVDAAPEAVEELVEAEWSTYDGWIEFLRRGGS